MAISINGAISGGTTGPQLLVKRVTFTGAAGLGAIGTVAVATTTGVILVEEIVGFCVTSLGVNGGTGAASVSLGVTSAVTQFATTTQADAVDAGEIWVSGTPTANAIAVPASCSRVAVTQNVIVEVTSTGTQLVDSGVLDVYITWRPLSSNGNLA